MSLFAEDLYSAGDFVEIPCEFCSELFPFELLMEHQSGCRPDLLHYNFEDDVPTAPVQPPVVVLPPKPAPVAKVVQAEQKSLNLPSTLQTNQTRSSLDKNSSSPKTSKQDATTKTVDPFEDLLMPEEIPNIFEDSNMQEGGPKLMSYGSSVAKRTEEEKPSFRAPPLPLLNNADQKEAEDACNSLSDDDDGECLEDFWKRAEIKNTQRLRKLKI